MEQSSNERVRTLPRVDDGERDDRDSCNLPLNDEEDQNYDGRGDDYCVLAAFEPFLSHV